MSQLNRVKATATGYFPTFKSNEANELRRWTVASIVAEAALGIVFGTWFAFHGDGIHWESLIMAYGVFIVVFATTLFGSLFSILIDKGTKNGDKIGRYKALLVALVFTTFAMAVLLTALLLR